MTTRRTPCRRCTGVRRGDVRAVGGFRRVPEVPSVIDWCRFLGPGSRSGLDCTGLLENSGRVRFSSLVDLAGVLPNGELSVDLVDLFATVGLRGEAEVATFIDRTGDELAIPVRAMMSGGSLVLSVTARRASASLTTSIRLCVPEWTDPDASFLPISMRVVSFSEFVQCQ